MRPIATAPAPSRNKSGNVVGDDEVSGQAAGLALEAAREHHAAEPERALRRFPCRDLRRAEEVEEVFLKSAVREHAGQRDADEHERDE
jgi:hypothetical protein